MSQRRPTFPDRSPISQDTGDQRAMVYRRDGQVWAFRWDAGQERLLLQAVGQLADTPDQAFDWVDAAVVCHCLGQVAAGHVALSAPPANDDKS